MANEEGTNSLFTLHAKTHVERVGLEEGSTALSRDLHIRTSTIGANKEILASDIGPKITTLYPISQIAGSYPTIKITY